MPEPESNHLIESIESLHANGSHDAFGASKPPTKGTSNRSRPSQDAPSRSKGAIFASILITLLLAAGIIPRLRQKSNLTAVHASLQDLDSYVEVVQPTLSPAFETLDLPSNVQAIQETTVYARTSGYVHQLLVDIGSHVHQGQALATIESPEIDQQLAESEANVAREQAGNQQSSADVFRLQAGTLAARAQISESRSGVDSALAEVAHAKSRVTEAQGAERSARAKLVEAKNRLAEAQSSLAQYRAKESLAEKTYRRWQELAKGGAVSGQELDETEEGYETSVSAVAGAQSAVSAANADVVSAQANVDSSVGEVSAALADQQTALQKVNTARFVLASSEANLRASQAGVMAGKANVEASFAAVRSSKSAEGRLDVLRQFETVTAPFSGVITARNIEVGSLIGAGSGNGGGSSDPQSTVPQTGMFGIARTDFLRVQVNVPQDYVEAIHKGDSATLTCEQFPGVVFNGRVFDTAGALDASTRTLLTEVRLPNPDSRLMPGMFTQVHFQVHRAHPSLRLASDALIIDAKGVRVAELTPESKVHFQTVKVGKDFGREVEILVGLSPAARVIENPADNLAEGESVKIVPPQS